MGDDQRLLAIASSGELLWQRPLTIEVRDADGTVVSTGSGLPLPLGDALHRVMEVVDLAAPGRFDVDIPAGELAVTRCQVCRSRWEDGDREFWLAARRWGTFPMACPCAPAICRSGRCSAPPPNRPRQRAAPSE